MKILVLFTSQFPYGKGETFLENESPFLYPGFDKVYIVTTWEPEPEIRPQPPHIEVISLSYKSSGIYNALSLLYLFHPLVWKEIYDIVFLYKIKLNKNIISTLLSSLSKGLKVKFFLSEKLLAGRPAGSDQVLLYSYWLNDFTVGLSLIKKQHPEIKAVARAHRWDLYFDARIPPYIPFRSYILGSLDYCYLISENGLHYLDTLTGKKFTNRLKLAKLGTFNPEGKTSGTNTGKLVLVSCSYIIPNKRVYLIIEALALIHGINIEWTHFGHGEQMEETKELATRKLAAGSVKYEFKDETNNSEILRYYAENNIDIFINVSSSEGIPVSMMEAMSYGIPVIGTDIGGVSEIIENNKNGILLPPNPDASEIASAIMKLWNLPAETKRQFRDAAFNKWNTEYNAGKNYKSFKQELDRLMSGK